MEQNNQTQDHQDLPTDEAGIIICKNCETQFVGQYCPNCGQHIKELERPIRFMFVDFMGTIVSFDTRLVKTLLAILFKPGKLTKDFVEGKRARYMPPFRFYVFISFVMFLLVSTITNNSIKDNKGDVISEDFKNIDAATKDSITTAIKDSIMLAVDETLKEELDSIQYSNYKSTISVNDSVVGGLSEMVEGINNFEDIVEGEDEKYADTIKLIQEHPELFMNKLFQFTSWALFLFMPLFAFFLWISFMRSKKLYIGHLIFSLNIHSFIFTVISLIVSVALIFPNHSTLWMGHLCWSIPIYQVIGARRLYKRRWLATFFKMTFVWFMYGFILTVGLITLVVVTFVGM